MIFSTAVVALTSLAAVNAGVIRRHDFAVPSTYDAPALEPYQGYHIRYLALGCHLKHNTTFFDQCCHPLLKTETLEKARPAQCIPAPAAASSASAALPTTTIVPDGDGDDEDCEDEDEEPASSEPAPAPASSSQAAVLPSAPANVAPAPSPESSSAPAPPKSSSEAKPSPTPAPAPPAPKPSPASSSAKPESSPSSGGGPFAKFFSSFSTIGNVVTNGIATFYFQKGNAGNCGNVNPDSAFIVALPTNVYANGAHCGKKVAIANLNNGKVQVATVADSCPTCENDQSLDMSTGLYDALGATRDQGTFPLAYAFIN